MPHGSSGIALRAVRNLQGLLKTSLPDQIEPNLLLQRNRTKDKDNELPINQFIEIDSL